jgi:hypothetical protein
MHERKKSSPTILIAFESRGPQWGVTPKRPHDNHQQTYVLGCDGERVWNVIPTDISKKLF